jgi:hypothetical protein
MAKLSDFREPQDANAREEWRRTRLPFTLFPQLSDASARTMLREILALRRQALRETGPERWAAFDDAQDKARELVEGIAGWAFYGGLMSAMASGAGYAELHTPLRRDAIRNVLLKIPLMTAPQRKEIVEALDALEWGQINKILVIEKKRRRRAQPKDAADAEFEMLLWIRWQVGRGRPENVVRGEVASAVGLSPEAVAKWRVAAEREPRLGKEYVRDMLRDAKAIGLMETQGFEADDRPKMVLARTLRQFSLQVTANRWKKAREPN